MESPANASDHLQEGDMAIDYLYSAYSWGAGQVYSVVKPNLLDLGIEIRNLR